MVEPFLAVGMIYPPRKLVNERFKKKQIGSVRAATWFDFRSASKNALSSRLTSIFNME